MFLSLLAIPFVLGQTEFKALPKPKYDPAVIAGQREIALGPAIQHDVTMEVRYEYDTPAEFTSSSTFGAQTFAYSKGYVRWSVTDGRLFDKPCRILKMDGITKNTLKFKQKRLDYASRNQTTYWISLEGKILRQSVKIEDPTDTKSAECTYASDHIDAFVSDAQGRRSFTAFPKEGMSKLDDQFKPMVLDNKVVLSHKEYVVFDPFTQAFTPYEATYGGIFRGEYFATKFEGIHVDIRGPSGKTITFISKEGDMVKAQFSEHLSLSLNCLPESRDPFYQKTSGEYRKLSGGR